MNRDIKKFIPRLIQFVFPYAMLTLFTIVLFLKSGEIFWFNKTLEAQTIERKNFVIGTAYSNLPHYFRLKALENCKPEIIALGTSRVLQFRQGFFKDSIPFYTTGGVFKRLDQLRAFLESVPENDLPKAILLGLDQWFFNSRYDSSVKSDGDLIYTQYTWMDNWSGLEDWQKFYYDWFSGKITWNKIWNKSTDQVEWFGISAIMKGYGFRKDGSRAYGNMMEAGTLFRRVEGAINEVKTDNGLFKWSNQISPEAQSELRILLRFCKKNGITVTGFIPPIHSKVLSELRNKQKKYPEFFELYNYITPVFRDYGFHVYDFTETASIGGDSEMIDAVHGSEKMYLRIYLYLLKKEGYLNQYSDSIVLKENLKSANGNFEVFGNK